MQLNITTDYAIRTVVYLASVNRIASSSEIAQIMSIPRKYLINIIGTLKKAGIVNTHSGQYGGYSLMKTPDNISLYDIIYTMEGTAKINRCLEEDRSCSRFATENCPVRRSYEKIQSKWEEYLKSVTIASLLAETGNPKPVEAAAKGETPEHKAG